MGNLNTPCAIFLLEIFLSATEQGFIHFNEAETKARGLTLVSRHLCQECMKPYDLGLRFPTRDETGV